MTVNRDKKVDINQTNTLLLQKKKPLFNGESWLGHKRLWYY
jgi:hypothetical protein